MLLSLAVILLIGLSLGSLFQRFKMPRILGMLLGGVLIGPYVLNFIDPSILAISEQLRKIALVVILLSAGLSLDLSSLKKNGIAVALMSALPAIFELIGAMLISHWLLGISYLDGAILGAILGAVSPAVLVPNMIRLIKEGRGMEKGIPQMLIAGSSMDDIVVIVIFTALMDLSGGNANIVMSVLNVPISIVLGIGVGILIGYILSKIFKRFPMRDTYKILVVLSASIFFAGLEDLIEPYVAFAGLLTVITIGAALYKFRQPVADRLYERYSKLWLFMEIILFVLVGAAVDVTVALQSGLAAVAVIVGALVCRSIGVLVCLIFTKFNWKEKLFCIIAYIPKATVQAAIGAIPLAAGLPSGAIILSVAVLSILITAPLGAILIKATSNKLLTIDKTAQIDVPIKVAE